MSVIRSLYFLGCDCSLSRSYLVTDQVSGGGSGTAGGLGGTNPVDCTDARCGAPDACSDTPLPGYCCGDMTCDGVVECDVCDLDCGGDPACDACVPTSSKEKGPRCSDGLDNDCDGLIDGADPDC